MATWYVATTGLDTNDGTTAGTPFLTILKGANSAAAGDTITVADGDYQFGINITTGAQHGTAALPITLKSTNKYGAKIKALSSLAISAPAVDIRRDYWIMDGFEVDLSGGYTGSGETWTLGGIPVRVGIYYTGNKGTVKNCHVHDIARHVNTSNGGAGILMEYFYGGTDHTVLYNWVHHIGPVSSATKYVHGIYLAANTTVSGNLAYRINGACIHGWHAAGTCSYVNNTVFNGSSGLLCGTGDGGVVAGGITNYRVFNNIVRDCVNGIIENGTIGAGNLFDSNLVFNCTTRYSLTGVDAGTQTNDTNANPLFVNWLINGGGDYSLSSTSPGIGIGIASLGTSPTINAPTSDIAGNSRPLDTTYDLGAYEYLNPPGLALQTRLPAGRMRRVLR